jgi:hypothetical protein
MGFHSVLHQHMVGVYRYGDYFRIFPQPGIPNWDVLVQHEFVHAVLAISTSAGFIHHVLAYLSYLAGSPNSSHWRRLFQKSMALAETTHESAATFSSLCEIANDVGHEKAFALYKIPRKYRSWYLLLDRIIPTSLSSSLRQSIGTAIASYAFDDPLSAFDFITWDKLLSYKDAVGFLPRVDERFYALIDLIKKDNILAVVADSGDGQSAIPPEGAPVRDFLKWRRFNSYRTSLRLRRAFLERYGNTLEALPGVTESLAQRCGAILADLKTVFKDHGDPGLAQFQRDFSDKEGEDPLFYHCEVVMPNVPLSGLVRIPHPGFLQSYNPSLVTVMSPVMDSMLSETLILHKGQYYARYYFFDGYQRRPEVFYSITESFPTEIWSLTAPVFLHGDTEIDLSIVDEVRPASSRRSNTVLVWLRRISPQALDRVLARADDWEFEFVLWEGLLGIATFLLFNLNQNTIWTTTLAGAALEIFAEDAQKKLRRLKNNADTFRHVLQLFLQVFPHECPSEGVPISR